MGGRSTTWTIEALNCGILRNVAQAQVTYGEGFGEWIDIPLLAYLIRGDGGTFLVDAGPESAEHVARSIGSTVDDTDGRTILKQLAHRGLVPADIDAVLVTHLHWDHVGGCRFLPHVPVYVQRIELEFAAAPLPTQLMQYESPILGLDPYWAKLGPRVRVVDGDVEVASGIRLVRTPGHTDGHQSVVVETDAGRYCVAGDLVDTFDNWSMRRPLWPEWIQGIPPGNLSNVHEWYDSVARIRAMGCEILPSHEMAMVDAGVIGRHS